MNAVVKFQEPRLPYHEVIEERFGVDRAGWKALAEAVFPLAKTADSIVMALSYCRARKLDPFKKPVHIVPMWSSAKGAMVETVWPGIAELRTTAFRTGQYAGCDAAEFGPDETRTFEGTASRGASKGEKRTVEVTFPTWCRMTVTRILHGKERRFVGPKVYWLEAYARWADTDVPNDMWTKRGVGQLEKCSEAAALRRAFPEEIGNDLTAEEMEGQRLFVDEGPRGNSPLRALEPPAPPPLPAPDPPRPPAAEAPPPPPPAEIVSPDTGEIRAPQEVAAEIVEEIVGALNEEMLDHILDARNDELEALPREQFGQIEAADIAKRDALRNANPLAAG